MGEVPRRILGEEAPGQLNLVLVESEPLPVHLSKEVVALLAADLVFVALKPEELRRNYEVHPKIGSQLGAVETLHDLLVMTPD